MIDEAEPAEDALFEKNQQSTCTADILPGRTASIALQPQESSSNKQDADSENDLYFQSVIYIKISYST